MTLLSNIAGVCSSGAQSVAGDKTFTGQATFAGGTVGVTATATNTEINVVSFPSSVGSGDGVWSETGTVFDSGLSTTSTAGDLPLAGITSTAIKMIANASGAVTSDYVSTTLTMPATLLNRKLKVDIWMRPGTGFASSEWTVSVYSGSTRMSLSTDSSGVTYLPNATGKFVTTFDADSSATYTLRFARVSGSGSATLNVCNVVVGPGIQPQGAVVEDWKSYTPTVPSLSIGNGTLTGKYRRVGDTMEVDLYALLGSSSTISGTLAPVIPLGLTIDTTKLASGTDGSDFVLGLVSYTDATVANYEGKVTYGSTTSVTLRITRSDSTWSNPGFTANATSPFTFATGDSIRARFTVPIAEWAGSGTCNVAGNDVEYASNSSTTDADDTASLAYGSIGSLVPTITASATNANRTKRVSFQTPIQSGDSIVVEIQDSGTGAWIPVGVNNNYLARTYQNAAGTTAFYGIGWVAVNSTTIDVGFGRAGRITSGTGYGTAGPNYPANAGDKWRVRKTSAGAAVGFGLATSTSAGLVGTGAQSFAGAKTFSNNVLLNANLGIGTTSPGSRVTVIDTVTTTGQTIQVEGSQTSGHVAYLYSNATMAGNVLRVYQDGAGSTASALFAYSDGSEAPITSVSNNSSSYVINAFTNAVASNSNNTKYIRFAGSSGGDDGYIQTNGSAVLSLVDVSDERLKCNIKDASYGLEQIMQLRPVEFNWVTSPSSAPVKGFIAQEVKPILPESVIITATSELKDQHSLETQTMIPVLVKAIQEQQEIIKSLQLKVAALEAKLPA